MKRLNIIIVAEGAIDHNNKPITTDYIKNVSTEYVVKQKKNKTSVASSSFDCLLYDLYYCTAALVWL